MPDTDDPIALLKSIVEWGATTASDRDMHIAWLRTAIAAWEKERAGHGYPGERQTELDYQALRAEVLKVAEEIERSCEIHNEWCGCPTAARLRKACE